MRPETYLSQDEEAGGVGDIGAGGIGDGSGIPSKVLSCADAAVGARLSSSAETAAAGVESGSASASAREEAVNVASDDR